MEKAQWNTIDKKQNGLQQPKNEKSSTPVMYTINNQAISFVSSQSIRYERSIHIYTVLQRKSCVFNRTIIVKLKMSAYGDSNNKLFIV